ncbi:hypothetical protein ACVJGD_001706 [Bradyrhizobium sp. USDA 10063]
MGGHLHAAHHVAAADHDRNFGPEMARRDQVVGDAVDGGLVDAEGLAAGEVFRPKA